MTIFIQALLIGCVGGLTAALLGVGGGIIMVPMFVMLLGLEQKVAVATSLAVIMPTAVAATYKNAGNNFVNWYVVLATALGAVVVAWFAADALKGLSNAFLQRLFAIVLIVVGVRMLMIKQ